MLLWEAVGKKKIANKPAAGTVKAITTRHRHIQADDRCMANTRIGRRCRCRRASGSEFCNFHDPAIAAQIRERAKAKRETKRRQLAGLPEEYMRTLTSPDGIAHALEHLFREVRLGVVSTRTAQILLGILDRMLAYDRLLGTVGPRKANRKIRAREVHHQVMQLLEELRLDAPPAPVSNNQIKGQANSGVRQLEVQRVR